MTPGLDVRGITIEKVLRPVPFLIPPVGGDREGASA